jgi:hypothetical protein
MAAPTTISPNPATTQIKTVSADSINGGSFNQLMLRVQSRREQRRDVLFLRVEQSHQESLRVERHQSTIHGLM